MGEVLTVAAGLAQVGVVLASALWGVPTGEVMVRGKATHYAAGRMQEGVEYRGGVLAGYAGGGALNRAGGVGRRGGVVGDGWGVRAAGGVWAYADVLNLIQAGATRIGTSAGVSILEEMPLIDGGVED